MTFVCIVSKQNKTNEYGKRTYSFKLIYSLEGTSIHEFHEKGYEKNPQVNHFFLLLLNVTMVHEVIFRFHVRWLQKNHV